MKARLVVIAGGAIACAGVISALGACASDDTTPVTAPPDVVDGMPADAAAEADSSDAAEARTCSDCEYFPAECSDDVLCPSGPFDQNNPAAGLDLRSRVNTIRGRSSNDVWVAGALGALAHFDGTAWKRSDTGATDSVRALWLRRSEEILFTTMKAIHTRGIEIEDGADAAASSPDGWTGRSTYTVAYDYYSSSLVLTSGWAADGAEWFWCTTRTTNGSYSRGLWRMHFVESAQRFEFDSPIPSGGCQSIPCSSMTSIHGSSANDLWAVGAFGAVLRITNADGDAPIIKAYNSQTFNVLNGVWVASENDAWAVGEGGVIRHFTGDPSAWDIVPDVPTTETLNAIWGASPSDIWAVGDKGLALHYDGSRWARVKIAGLDELRRPDLTAVWMPSPNHVWIGGQGIVLSLGGKP